MSSEITLGSGNWTFNWDEIMNNFDKFNKILNTNFTKLTPQDKIHEAFIQHIADKITSNTLDGLTINEYVNATFSPYVVAD